jgi:catechol 2,3-dioxygenase-like lactoylglutathione lyase family enzyme
MTRASSIRGLHHSAYRCRDSGETRAFYEDFLGLPLVNTLEIRVTKTNRATDTLHTFFAMADGSCLAFFEAPDLPFEFRPQLDYDLHIALEVDRETLRTMLDKGRALGVDTRGIVDHALFESLYFRDPNGYVVELCSRLPGHAEGMDPRRNKARERLDRWLQRQRAGA